MTNPIVGKFSLALESAVPDDGLSVSRLRVELSDENNPVTAWIAELQLLGNLPWKRGEERRVKVRIMSSEFRRRVVKTGLKLQVSRGGTILGTLEIEST